MAIIIKRNTGSIGSWSRFPVKLNGKKVAKLSNNQEMEIEIPDATAQLKATHFMEKSNEIEVRDGDVVEIKTAPWSYVAVFLVFLHGMLLTFLPPTVNRLGVLIVFLTFLIGSSFFFDSHRLEIVDRTGGNEKPARTI